MSITSPPLTGGFPPPPDPARRFTVAEYRQMIQRGVLTEDDPVELLEGWIVPKRPRNPPHDGALQRSNKVITRRLPPGWEVRVQCAVTTAASEPEPDLAVVREADHGYMTHHPGPPEIGTLIQVADSSLAFDRNDKGRAYARASIVIYWVINLVDRQIEVYTDPTGPAAVPAYRQRQLYGIDDFVPLVLDGQEIARIAVRDLLPDQTGRIG